MVIRYANETDDFKALAKLMYETDRYIYPYWFKTKEEGVEEISKLLKRENTSFYYKKCIVAEIDGEIVGILLYFDDESPLDFAYADITSKNFNYSYTLKNYVIPLEKSIKENQSYVAGLRVSDNHARQGIAQSLFKFYFNSLKKGTCVRLDVLVENERAFNLYKKIGFEITSKYKGFKGYRKKRVECYSMQKIIK